MIGKTLAHYEVTAEIGKGGMGEVYRARDTKLGRDVALKLLPPDFAEDPERLQRFEREARVLASLSHPNIATIHGFERDGQHRFLVLELVEGEDLAERLGRERIPTQQVLAIALQIARGMEAAHESGIIHRDLKPANIKQARDGSVKILDFGLARNDATEPDIEHSPTITAEQTQDGTLLGTVPYMSPEQLKGRNVDVRTDIWAFGCVLYEMLTGVSPFRAGSFPEIMARTLEHEPAWDELPADLPPTVVWLLRRCLMKDASERMHSAADIRIVMQESETSTSLTPEASPVASKSRARHTAIVAIAAFVLGGLAGGIALNQSQRTGDVVRDPIRLMIPVRDDAAVVPLPESPSVAISPDGRTIVYVASSKTGGKQSPEAEFLATQLYRRPIDGFESTPIDGTAGGAAPFFSPDGAWIGFFDFHNGTIKKVSVGGGLPQQVCVVKGLTYRGSHWSDDGTIYFGDGRGLFVVDADGGQVRAVAQPDAAKGEKTYRFPHLLPGGRALIFTRGSSKILSYDEADVALLDLDSGDIRVLATGGLDPQYIPTGHIVFGRAGKAYALPFDADRLEATGSPVEVLDGVVTSDGYGSIQLTCSDDGTLVYVAGGPEQFAKEIMFLHRDGRIEPIPQPMRPYGNVALSPDAKRLVVSVLGANASLWIYELERGTMTKLVSDWDNFSPAWGPSGDVIVFGSNRGGAMKANNVWLTAADGTGEPTILYEIETNAYPNAFSPDGKTIAFSNLSPSTGMDIWLVDRNGKGEPALASGAREMHARFSPDGRYLSHTSDESGQSEVYVQEFPITGRKWKLSENGGDLPVWSRDGTEIYYWSGHRLMVVRVEAAPKFEPGRARVVLEADVEVHDYDVLPDRERFVVLGRRVRDTAKAAPVTRSQGRLFPAQSPDLRVVLNWFDEVTELTSQ